MVESTRAGTIGDNGGTGGAGMADVGESSKDSLKAGGVSNAMVSCVDERWGGDGIADGGVAGGSGVAGLERGERRSSLSFSSSIPRSSSASLRRLRTRLAGGGIASDGERDGGVAADLVHSRGAITQAVTAASGDGVVVEAVHNGVAFTRAGTAASGDSGCGRDWFSVAAVAARARRFRRRRRRRLPAVAVDMGEVGRKHVKVIVWRPAAWLISTRAFNPLTMQRSYNAVKSAAVTDGGDVGQAGSLTQVATPPLTTLAHVGEAREVGGRGEVFDSCCLACPAGSPRPQRRGRQGGVGLGEMTVLLLGWCPPSPITGGGWR
jgi:hypothetical protein